MSEMEKIEKFSNQVNIILVLDHGGRAGSNFYQCLFDAHQECITSPLIHYVYSYWHSIFGDAEQVSAKDAHDFVAHKAYSRFLYHNPEGEFLKIIRKIGCDETAPFDRERFRNLVDDIFSQNRNYGRREIITKLYAAYALCRDFDLDKAKYIQINDAVSVREENLLNGFSVKLVGQAIKDFPDGVILALLRDPRAQYASTRHQMVNEFGNNYDIHLGGWWSSFFRLWNDNISLDHGPAHFCLMYQVAAYRSLMQAWQRGIGKWLFLKNEDFNTDFVPTMVALCKQLGINPDPEWIEKGDDYKAKMMGKPWAGTGAYSTRYQNVTDGPLSNDTQEQVAKMTGPNKYVTERWKSRIPRHEQALLEEYFKQEIQDLEYSFLIADSEKSGVRKGVNFVLPWSGEWPKLRWIGKAKDKKIERIFYTVTFLPYYVLSRLKLHKYAVKDCFFQNDFPDYSVNDIPFIRADRSDY